MFIKHSLKNLFRSWPKTLLFFLLLTALSVTLCVGISMSAAIMGFLRDCDENYKTIAVFEYIGVNYPDETKFDPEISAFTGSFDMGQIERNPAVLRWDSNTVAFGSIEGKTENASVPPYAQYTVAVIYILSYNESEKLYQYVVEKDLINPDAPAHSGYLDPMGAELSTRHFYLIHSARTSGATSYEYYGALPVPEGIARRAGIDNSPESLVVDITNEKGRYTLPEDSAMINVARTYATVNSGVSVFAVGDLDTFLPFHQANLYVTSGRTFTAEECAGGAKVCVLPARLAQLIDARVGGQITLSAAVWPGAIAHESYWAGDGFDYTDSYTVVGILNPNDDYRDCVFIPKSKTMDISVNQYSYTLGQALIKNDQAGKFYDDMQAIMPPRVRVTILDQGYAAAAEPMRDVLRIAIILTAVCALTTLAMLALFGFLFVYRQRDLTRTMRRNGASKGGIFCYFTFGSGCLALFSSVLGAVISSRLSGFFAGIVEQAAANFTTNDLNFSNSALSITKKFVFALRTPPLVFVLSALALFASAIMACFIFTALSMRSGGRRRRKQAGSARDAAAPAHDAAAPAIDAVPAHDAAQMASPASGAYARGATLRKSRSLNGGALKYAWLSVARGASRSALPTILCALAAVLLIQLTAVTVQYQASFDTLVSESDISGYLTDLRGIWKSGFSIGGPVANDIYKSGVLSSLSLTKVYNYAYGLEYPEPMNPFTMETFNNTVNAGPDFIYTNDPASTQEFYGCAELPVTFMDGYDISIFQYYPPGEMPDSGSHTYSLTMNEDGVWVDSSAEPAPDTADGESNDEGGSGDETGNDEDDSEVQIEFNYPSAIVSTHFLECNGLALGDVIEFPTNQDRGWTQVKIVGSFVRQGTADNIYVPLHHYIEHLYSSKSSYHKINGVEYITGMTIYSNVPSSYVFNDDATDLESLRKLGFGSASFMMKGAKDLQTLKDYLYEKGFSQVNNIRTVRSYIVIEDKTFLAAQRAMSQRLWYMQKIFPALYVLIELLAGLVPFILIKMRRRESALMRAQGAGAHTAFFCLFWEQTMLCLPGAAIGVGAWYAAFARPSQGSIAMTATGMTLVAAFAMLWLIGSAVSAASLNFGSVREVLKAAE